jgi:hypothetical protein
VPIVLAATLGLGLLTGCATDQLSTPLNHANPLGQNEAVMAKFRANANGCSFSISDPTGVRMIVLRTKELPFGLPPVQEDRLTHYKDGRVVRAIVAGSAIDTVTVDCLTSSHTTSTDFVRMVMAAAMTANWRDIEAQILRAPRISLEALHQMFPKEKKELAYEILDPSGFPMPLGGANQSLRSEVCGLMASVLRGRKANLTAAPCNCYDVVEEGVTHLYCEDNTGSGFELSFSDTGYWDGIVTCNAVCHTDGSEYSSGSGSGTPSSGDNCTADGDPDAVDYHPADGGGTFDAVSFASYLDLHKKPAPDANHQCAHYVGEALCASTGGHMQSACLTTGPRPDAHNWGPWLQVRGFDVVIGPATYADIVASGYVPRLGDIAVFTFTGGGQHVCAWGGDPGQWIGDYGQKGVFGAAANDPRPSPGSHPNQPYTIYRRNP